MEKSLEYRSDREGSTAAAAAQREVEIVVSKPFGIVLSLRSRRAALFGKAKFP
jgi:hypothetical protein